MEDKGYGIISDDMLDYNPKHWVIGYEPPEVTNITKPTPWDNDEPEDHILKDYNVVLVNTNSFVQYHKDALSDLMNTSYVLDLHTNFNDTYKKLTTELPPELREFEKLEIGSAGLDGKSFCI